MQQVLSKKCIKCGKTKPVTEFVKDKRRPDGRFPYCKRCRSKNQSRYDEKAKNTSIGLVHCSACNRWLNPSEFYSNPSAKSGIHHQCKDCSRENAREWKNRHPEKYRKKNHDRWWNNISKESKRNRVFYENNSEREKARTLEYSRTPAGKAVQARANHFRRIMSKEIPATLSDPEWQEILELQDNRCACCNREFSDVLPPTRDHIIPASKRGGLTKENTQALCKSCNSRKKDKTIDYRRTGSGS